ncbi:uncharacterized protein MJAP1_002060 [Malassezia japonica]|uniref:Smr domain-containing protein n=1 Tax=Malassezia japonica TaxID=223818 RepID=A0AAF0JAQ8_9BASI|nr:uncharacterized protein MJAP1_002060 [Malassezia japonica]WFD39089.1 hypothetical protein MJAP1_002060 [Malassezia japonica]
MGEGADANALLGRFCPPLDPSLVLAIASEPDRDEEELAQILQGLADATRMEDAAEQEGDAWPEDPVKEEPAQEEPAQEEPAQEEPAQEEATAMEEPAEDGPSKKEPVDVDCEPVPEQAPEPAAISDAPLAAAVEELAVDDYVLAFLVHSFPDKPPESLQKALDDAHGDVDVAMDALLAEDMLSEDALFAQSLLNEEEQARRTHTPTEAKHIPRGGLDLDALVSGTRPKKGSKAKSKLPGKKPMTVSLTDQRSAHHIYAEKRGVSTPKREKAPSPTIEADEFLDDEELARRLQNAERDAVSGNEKLVVDQQWLLASSTLSQLASLLDVPLAKIQSIFHQSSLNLHVAMARAIAYAAAQPASIAAQESPVFPTVVETLASISSRDPRKMAEVLAATQGEQSAALDLLQLQDVVAQAASGASNRPDILDPTGQLVDESAAATTYTPTVTQKRKPAVGGAPRWLDSKATSYADRTAQPAAALSGKALAARALSDGQAATVFPASAQRVELSESAGLDLDQSYTSEECRQRADELRAKRNAALRQAATSARRYRGGAMAGLSGAASVYAEEARKYDAAARRWQMRGASALVDQRRADYTGVSEYAERIDLHGLSVHEALTVVEHTVHRASAQSSSRTFLEIVTGRGVHSRHNVSVIRPAIVRLLAQRGYTVDSTTNPGVLYVKHAR